MATGSEKLDQIVERLKGTADPKRRYEYVLWLAKNSSRSRMNFATTPSR